MPATRRSICAHYYANHRWFFTLGTATIVIAILKDKLLTGAWPYPPLNLAMELALIVIFLAGAVFSNERAHKLLAPLATICFALYIASLFPRLH